MREQAEHATGRRRQLRVVVVHRMAARGVRERRLRGGRAHLLGTEDCPLASTAAHFHVLTHDRASVDGRAGEYHTAAIDEAPFRLGDSLVGDVVEAGVVDEGGNSFRHAGGEDAWSLVVSRWSLVVRRWSLVVRAWSRLRWVSEGSSNGTERPTGEQPEELLTSHAASLLLGEKCNHEEMQPRRPENLEYKNAFFVPSWLPFGDLV